ncbi:hypothetical protein BDA96_08G163200 [Sorghum bicolor]|uniref:Uncharacterized protein n=2 Tax=Sorghum bicolor TaxID=4558 RepID=A0A921QGK4_SORBI|nr:hypothetical protein BDA96_08G163200 [Sorghum bicolor]OQU79453.1 hypothetical protein SORBI_3008G146801 [Sorghum bicolor]
MSSPNQQTCEWTYALVVGLSSGMLPTKVQTLVTALFLENFQNFQGTRTCARSLVLHVSRALEETPPNLLFACGMSVECVGCVCPNCTQSKKKNQQTFCSSAHGCRGQFGVGNWGSTAE